MTDLRAKFTLQLDDRLTAAARRALSAFRKEADEAAGSATRSEPAMGRMRRGLERAKSGADETSRKVDTLSSSIRKLQPYLDRTEKKAPKAFDAFATAANIKHAADNLQEFGRGAAGLIEAPIRKYADFEAQISSVKAATFDLTKAMDASKVAEMNAEVTKLSAQARQLGADTQFSASEVAAGMDILAKNFSGSDIEKAQAIRAAMPGILDAAAAMKGSIEEVSDIGTAAMNQFGMSASDMGRIGDVLTKTANSSATGLTDLGEALKYSGVTAKDAGIDLETTLGIIGALGNAGKKGSVAGTGLASVIGNLQSGNRKQKDLLRYLGVDVKDKAGNLKPIVDLLAEIDKAIEKKVGAGAKGGVRRDRMLQGLVGMGGDKEALAIMLKQARSGELGELISANRGAEGAAKKVAAEMGNNAVGAAKNLDSAYEELQLTVGERVIPQVTNLLKWSTDAINSISAWSRENPVLVKGLVAVAGGLAAIGLVVAPVLKGIGAVITVFGALAKVISVARLAFTALKVAALANPIAAIAIGIATAALLIYEYWEPIKGFFGGLWDGITSAFRSALDWIVGKIEWASDRVTALREAVTGNLIVDERKAKDQRTTLAGLSPEQAARLQGLGGTVGETIARVRDDARREGAVSIASTANSLRTMSAAGAASGAAGGGRGELLVRVSDERIKVESRESEGLPVAMRLPRGSAT